MDYTNLHMACALKNKTTGCSLMTEEVIVEEQPALSRKQKTKLEKQAEHIDRIKRTGVACLMGIFVGILSLSPGDGKK